MRYEILFSPYRNEYVAKCRDVLLPIEPSLYRAIDEISRAWWVRAPLPDLRLDRYQHLYLCGQH